MLAKPYQLCTRCAMDTSDPEIEFDNRGYCNHCRSYYDRINKMKNSGQFTAEKLNQKIDEIKKHSKTKEYDSILGLSGGVDSSFLAYNAYEFGLRPLIVHFDNGWNSELAVKNIENIVKKLNFDLYTYVIDWEEFRDLQRSFFHASVIDIEMLTDHAIMATMFKIAKKHKIKYVLSGTNLATESILPTSWFYYKWDIKNIKAIQKKFGTKKIKNFPIYGLFDLIASRYVNGFKYVEILNYLNYNKEEAIKILQRELDWRYYGGKHYESIFTKYYQGVILPTKFGIDKRRAHLSSLICSGQISRESALEELKSDPYNPNELEKDKEYVLKKLCFSEKEFDDIMQTSPISHLHYANLLPVYNILKKIQKLFFSKY